MAEGSSPHTRGARDAVSESERCHGIIPAYAGSTSRARVSCRRLWDHPRIRGEHEVPEPLLQCGAGSSPHTRGARLREAARGGRGWIIPAYAGSTRRRRSASPRGADHPRIRGEHRRPVDPRQSPRRIIPAYAGSTRVSFNFLAVSRDHPRIRGEHGVCAGASECLPGSSPHTRGAPRRRRLQGGPARIIPAYAGSTGRRRVDCRRAPDHPRIRGEHVDQVLAVPGDAGSSPHTRGALAATAASAGATGIIPAYAGSTMGPKL